MNYKKEIREHREKKYYYAEQCTCFLSGICVAKTEEDLNNYREKLNYWLELLIKEVDKIIYFNKIIDGDKNGD